MIPGDLDGFLHRLARKADRLLATARRHTEWNCKVSAGDIRRCAAFTIRETRRQLRVEGLSPRLYRQQSGEFQ